VRSTIVLTSLLALGACGGGFEPVSYRIARVDGTNLPFALRQDGNCPHLLLEGFMDLPDDSTYKSTFNIQIVCPDSARPVHDPGNAGKARRSNDTIFFSNTDGRPAGHGVLMGDSMIVKGPAHQLTYMRIRDDAPRVGSGG